jgi:hypothetical protein
MNSNKKTNQDKKLKYYFDDISNKVEKVNQNVTTKLQKKKKTKKKLQFFPNHCIDLSRQITHPSQHPKNLPKEEESADLHPLAADLQPLAAVRS